MTDHVKHFMASSSKTALALDYIKIDTAVEMLANTREIGGRVFVLGVGGSAGNASHMVNDLRKLCGIQAYAPTDNVSELTARTNDEGWRTVFREWLITSCLSPSDCIVILSVGGGSKEHNISMNLVHAIEYAKDIGCPVVSIVGKPDGYAAQYSDIAIVVPYTDEKLVTPISEAFQAVVWHCMVSHPELQKKATTW
jgi:D-sedoheptulose 7-phosphate isomerase